MRRLPIHEPGVAMGVTPGAPGHVPERVAHLAAHEERRVEEQSVPAGRVEDLVEDPQVGLVVAALGGLDGLPREVDPDRGHPRGRHRGEPAVEGVGAHPPRPVRALGRHQVGPDGQERAVAAAQIRGAGLHAIGHG